jgi:hypothetical protein
MTWSVDESRSMSTWRAAVGTHVERRTVYDFDISRLQMLNECGRRRQPIITAEDRAGDVTTETSRLRGTARTHAYNECMSDRTHTLAIREAASCHFTTYTNVPWSFMRAINFGVKSGISMALSLMSVNGSTPVRNFK